MGAEIPTVTASIAEKPAIAAAYAVETGTAATATEFDERMLVIGGFCKCPHCWSGLQTEFDEFAPGVIIDEVVKTLSIGEPKHHSSISFQTTWSVLRVMRANSERCIRYPFAGVPTAIDEAGFRLLQPAREIEYGQ